MCGISGTFAPDGGLDRSLCVAMHNRLTHRGPDEAYSLNTASLSAKLARLGMIGLQNGWQPVEEASGRFVALTNGEIYNAESLFRELGIPRPSGNGVDVAILPELVARYGIDGLEKIDGQFASVIHDRLENTVYLARDRFGICPLFYTTAGHGTHFCSELKPLVQSVPGPWRLDYAAVDQYFSLGNIVAPRTLVAEVSAVEPGCAVKISEDGRKTLRYWRYGTFTPTKGPVDAEAIREGVRDSIAVRLHSDVEIGSYLSGGFDSTAILMDAATLSKGPMRSFSVTFDDPRLDEGRYQRSVAAVAGSVHEEVQCAPKDIAARFEKMVRHCCFPQRETYNVSAMMLSERVHKAGIKGVVSGEGADELFFGYDSYAFDSVRRRPPKASARNEQAWGRADFSWEVDLDRVEGRRRTFLSDHARQEIVGREFWRNRLIPYSETELTGLSPMQLRSIADVYVQLGGHLLGDHGDAMVMANSIEGRYPFLGNSVVSLALQVPDDKKVVNFEGKTCLKEAYRDTVPDQVMNRAKHGFTAYDLKSIVDHQLWQDWQEMVASVEALNPECMAGPSPETVNEKWDFRLGAISLAMIVDELGLRC
ncbi:asparagine synthase (glutamine-hydrolyzing) [Desulfoluna butyratoxydans]|uniref:asparagine synthase (glutamine-hydrolyzing) n=1 Tax=Desulfoluna butyratoxydans TaxID=231438 RepID=A0A4U8YLZ4_9BACT|nr:asparagine synthase (glutamine-hydrolyzing) [Desulfoluna butyratoxydans]VFQ44179.1 asparagine synthase glutamine-hydrolyzing [Desulfoluna butyratoxydans]